MRVVRPEDPEARTLGVVAQQGLVGEVEVLVRVDPQVAASLVPEHREEPARPLGIAVAVDVALQTRPVDPHRVGPDLVEERDAEDPVAGRRVRRVAVAEAAAGRVDHVIHVQPPAVVLDLGVERVPVDRDLGDLFAVEVAGRLQLGQQHVRQHVDHGDRDAAAVPGRVPFPPLERAHVAERGVAVAERLVGEDRRPDGVGGRETGGRRDAVSPGQPERPRPIRNRHVHAVNVRVVDQLLDPVQRNPRPQVVDLVEAEADPAAHPLDRRCQSRIPARHGRHHEHDLALAAGPRLRQFPARVFKKEGPAGRLRLGGRGGDEGQEQQGGECGDNGLHDGSPGPGVHACRIGVRAALGNPAPGADAARINPAAFSWTPLLVGSRRGTYRPRSRYSLPSGEDNR